MSLQQLQSARLVLKNITIMTLMTYLHSRFMFECEGYPYRALFFIGQIKLLTWQPGLHFSRLAVVLLSLQHSVQHHRPPLCLQLQDLPQLPHMPRPFTYELHLGSPQRSDNPRPVQNLLNTSPSPRELSLESLKDQSEVKFQVWTGLVTFQPLTMTKHRLWHLPGSFLHAVAHSGGYSHNPYMRPVVASPESTAIK